MVALALSEGLHAEWDDVVIEGTGEGAFYRLSMESFDLVVLDVALPGRDGLQILKSIRQLGVKTPVLVLSARDTVQDRIAGLDAGADDYLVKPFAFAELLARIRALMRRGVNESPTLSIGDLAIDLLSRRVTVAGTAVELTTREVELLVYLADRSVKLIHTIRAVGFMLGEGALNGNRRIVTANPIGCAGVSRGCTHPSHC